MKSRRFFGFFVLVTAFLLLVTAVSQAQTDPTQPPDSTPLIVHDPPKAMIDGVAEPLQDVTQSDGLVIPLTLMADEPTDSCIDAPSLIVFPTNPADGGIANVSDATPAADDPVLACQWGNPASPRGFRTVWYKLFAPVDGRVVIDTFNSNYDTVIGVFRGECGALVPLSCNDDHNGFSSQVTFSITAGETYYIEVADRNPSLPQPAHMQLSALLVPVNSQWNQPSTTNGPPPISRHAVVTQGQYLYVVGGQSGDRDPGLPQISNRLLRMNANADPPNWQELASMPGAGYSNTTAALVGNHIYIPTGYNGNNQGYDGLHWQYTIDPNPAGDGSWRTVASIPTSELPHGVPFAWASAAVPPSQNKYYLTGGLSSTHAVVPPVVVEDTVVKDTYVYLTDSNTWLKQKPMQAGRYAHTAAWIEGNNLGVCVAGGLGVQVDQATGQLVTVLHRSAECYQAPGGNWHFIGDMNVPRFGAGSAVGPDGKWYVFGGMTTLGSILIPVRQTEVYDPIRNTWTQLGPSFNLGNFETNPPRFWPRGATIGNNLWVVGGSYFDDEGEQALPVLERLNLPTNTIFVPVLSADYDDALRPDDTFAEARPLSFGINETRNFDQQRDFFDVYTFEIQSSRSIQVTLIVPDDNNFDVLVYGRQKTKWGEGVNPRNGVDEQFSINNLPPNRYYVVVVRAFPTGQPDKGAYYTLGVQ